MKNYAETIELMQADGWFRVTETTTHIFFCKRLADGRFANKSVEYTPTMTHNAT